MAVDLPIGTTFWMSGVQYRMVEGKGHGCDRCAFKNLFECSSIYCSDEFRKDGKFAYAEKVDNNNNNIKK